MIHYDNIARFAEALNSGNPESVQLKGLTHAEVLLLIALLSPFPSYDIRIKKHDKLIQEKRLK